MRRGFLSLLAVTALRATLACSGTSSRGDAQVSGAREAGPGIGQCASHCSSLLWPRLIVDVDPAAEPQLTVSVLSGDAAVPCGRPHCPGTTESASLHCTCTVSGDPSVEQVELELSTPGQKPLQVSVPLHPFNYCGREIAYQSVALADDGGIALKPIKYVSPCLAL